MRKILSVLIAVVLGVSNAFATTVYCKMAHSWWYADGAAVAVHYWGSLDNATEWPGVRMTPVSGEEGTWSYDVPADVDGLIFVRVNGTGDISDWGAKTADLTLPTDGKNLFTITNETPSWGDPGCNGEWSVYGEESAPQPAPAAPYTMFFTYYNSTSSDSNVKLTTAEAIFDEASRVYVAKVETGIQVYAGRKYEEGTDSIFSNLKLGSSSAAGELKFILANPTEVDSIIFRAAMYSNTEGGDGFKVNGTNFTLSAGKLAFENKVWTPTGVVDTIDLVQNKASKGRFFLTSITVYPKQAGEEPPVEPTLANGFYLIGQNGWDVAALSADLLFAANPEAEGEYVLNTTLAEGQSIKVVKVENDAIVAWYPDGTDNEYTVDAAHAGEKDIYFQETYKAEWATFGGYFWMGANEEPQPQGCDWDAIEFLGSADPAYANQFKVCKPENVGVVNIQQPGFATEIGIYMTFPSAVFGTISLPESAYDIQGAGIIFHLSAFTDAYTEVTVNCDGNDLVFTVYNANGGTPVEPTLVNGFYLIGQNGWDVAALSADLLFAANPETEGEYKLTTTLAEDQTIKVVKVENDAIVAWYPDGMGTEYTVDAAHAGEKDIYFQETYKEEWAAFGGYFWMGSNDPTAISNTAADAPAVKVLRNGQILIKKGDKTYNVMGAIVR